MPTCSPMILRPFPEPRKIAVGSSQGRYPATEGKHA